LIHADLFRGHEARAWYERVKKAIAIVTVRISNYSEKTRMTDLI
jgi:hypothetical protein